MDQDDLNSMQHLLGFDSFDSTKGKHVKSNDSSEAAAAIRKKKKRQYRQFLNKKFHPKPAK